MPRGGVALLTTNGAVDTTFTPASAFNGRVRDVEDVGNGSVYVAGEFTLFGSNAVGHLVRLDALGQIDGSFATTNSGANGTVHVVKRLPDGKVLVGGEFTVFNNTPANRIVRLDTNGAIDTTFSVGVGPDQAVRDIALEPDGRIVVVGDFIQFAGRTKNRIVRLSATGVVEDTFASGSGANGSIESVSRRAGGQILVAGRFTSFNEQSRNRYAELLPNGALNTEFATGSGADDFVFTSSIYSPPATNVITTNTSVPPFATGQNTNVFDTGGTSGRIDITAQSPSLFFPNIFNVYYEECSSGASPCLRQIPRRCSPSTTVPDSQPRSRLRSTSSMFSVGRLMPMTQSSRRPMFRLERSVSEFWSVAIFSMSRDRNGTGWPCWIPTEFQMPGFGLGSGGVVVLDIDLNTNNAVPALLGKSVVVGNFSVLNGANANRVARLHADGSLDLDFKIGTGADAAVNAVVV